MSERLNHPWLHRFAVLTAVATFGLLGIGGLVTSHGAGMAVPDWPTSYGYNLFFLPIKFWSGGVFYEHTHRLWASLVGVLVVGLTRWLGGRASRKPLAIIGSLELLAGFLLLRLDSKLSGAGHFLTGIGAVVLLAAAVWARNAPAERPLPQLGWLAFACVQLQGLLGGLRVVLLSDGLGIFHATLAQAFFVLACAIAFLTSKAWQRLRPGASASSEAVESGGQPAVRVHGAPRWRLVLAGTTLLIFVQLILGATMRHQHAGLAIPDFPLAYGKLWPATDPESVARYNERRIEVTAANPITAFQIELQMAHRVAAALILAGVGFCARRVRNRLGFAWLGLMLAQAALGACTIWSNKAADIATAHVLLGALSLATGVLWCIVSYQSPEAARHAPAMSRTGADSRKSGPLDASAAA